MNLATHGSEGSASAPVLYMALELSNKTWRLAFSRLDEARLRGGQGQGTLRDAGLGPSGELLRGGPRQLLVAPAPEERRHRERGGRCRLGQSKAGVPAQFPAKAIYLS